MDHLVVKTVRPVERGDARDEALLDAEVPAFEGDQVAEFEQAFGSAGWDDSFRRKRRRFAMGAHVTGEIETEFDRRVDCGFDDDGSQ